MPAINQYPQLKTSDGASNVNFTQSGLGAVTRSVEDKLTEAVSVKDFGAVGNGVADDTAAIQAAIDAAIAAGGGEVHLPVGVFRTTATLDLDGNSVTLRGAGGLSLHTSLVNGSSGVVGEGRHIGPTRILADFTSGAVIRIWSNACRVTDLCVDASSTRRAAALSTNYGIRVEAADTSGASTKRTMIERVRITNQPSHGLVMVNDLVCSRVDMLDVDHVKGHGIYISGGVLTGRTNKTRPGQVQINNARVSRTGGHSLCVGGNDSLAIDVPYRVEVQNLEAFYNCVTTSVCVDPANPANGYLSGDNHQISVSAFDGRSEFPSTTDTHTCLFIRGNNIMVLNPRFIDGDPYAVRIVGHPVYSNLSRDITLDSVYLQNEFQSSGFYNPAVFFGSDVRGVKVSSDLALSIATTLTSRTAGTNYVESWNGTTRTDVDQVVGDVSVTALQAGYTRTSTEVTLADDKAGYIDFGAVSRGIIILAGTSSAARSAVVAFRVGDANAHATIMSSGGGTVTGTTGQLAGTTGTDTHLTIAADTATNRLYIENRTGGSRSYSYTVTPLGGNAGFGPTAFVNLP